MTEFFVSNGKELAVYVDVKYPRLRPLHNIFVSSRQFKIMFFIICLAELGIAALAASFNIDRQPELLPMWVWLVLYFGYWPYCSSKMTATSTVIALKYLGNICTFIFLGAGFGLAARYVTPEALKTAGAILALHLVFQLLLVSTIPDLLRSRSETVIVTFMSLVFALVFPAIWGIHPVLPASMMVVIVIVSALVALYAHKGAQLKYRDAEDAVQYAGSLFIAVLNIVLYPLRSRTKKSKLKTQKVTIRIG